MSTRRRFLRRAGIVLAGAPFIPAIGGAALLPGTGRPVDGEGPAGGDGGMVSVDRYCVTMGAVAGIRIWGPDERFCARAASAAFAEMRRVDRLLSAFDPGSAVGRINAAAGRDEVDVPPEVPALLESAGEYHRATGGAFDVTVGPLLDLYGFHDPGGREAPGRGPWPDDRAVTAALEAVGFGNVRIDVARGRVGLARPASRIDLGGIGVGYALDRAASVLRAMGVDAALLNHAGDILAMGAPPGSAGWEIGIQDPLDPRGTIASFSLRDRSVSTSGNYESYVETHRGRVGHIFDPATGRPPGRYLGVSVMAGTSLAADALSTGFFTGAVGLAGVAPAGAGAISAFVVRRDGTPGDGRRPVTEYHEHVGAMRGCLPHRIVVSSARRTP